MSVQASSSCHRVNAVLGDAQERKDYLGGFHTRVGMDGHSWHLGDEDGDEGRGSDHPDGER